jgi:hypothetical protein
LDFLQEGAKEAEEFFPADGHSAAEPQPTPYIRSDFTEGNEGNEGPRYKLRLFVTFCKNSDLFFAAASAPISVICG